MPLLIQGDFDVTTRRHTEPSRAREGENDRAGGGRGVAGGGGAAGGQRERGGGGDGCGDGLRHAVRVGGDGGGEPEGRGGGGGQRRRRGAANVGGGRGAGLPGGPAGRARGSLVGGTNPSSSFPLFVQSCVVFGSDSAFAGTRIPCARRSIPCARI
jgi:hypothetical protein